MLVLLLSIATVATFLSGEYHSVFAKKIHKAKTTTTTSASSSNSTAPILNSTPKVCLNGTEVPAKAKCPTPIPLIDCTKNPTTDPACKLQSSAADFNAGKEAGNSDAFNDGYHGNDFSLTKCQQGENSDFCRGYREGYTQSAFQNGVNHSTPQSNCEHFDTCGINAKPITWHSTNLSNCRRCTMCDATKPIENFEPASKVQSRVQVIAHFYDAKGNNIGGLQQVAVTPAVLKTLQPGVFNIKASTSLMSGTPVFLQLEFKSSS